MKPINPLQAEVTEYTIAEIARVGAEKVDMPAIVKKFVPRGISRATAYRWGKHAIANPATGRVAGPKAPPPSKDASPDLEAVKKPTRPKRLRRPTILNVRDIRTKLKLSQDGFARRFGFSVAAVRQWELGDRDPEAPACMFLLFIDEDPQQAARIAARWGAIQAGL